MDRNREIEDAAGAARLRLRLRKGLPDIRSAGGPGAGWGEPPSPDIPAGPGENFSRAGLAGGFPVGGPTVHEGLIDNGRSALPASFRSFLDIAAAWANNKTSLIASHGSASFYAFPACMF